MYEGWIALGGQEIANNERYAACAAALGLPVPRDAVRCPSLAGVLADTSYATTGVAGAPWHDVAAPESAGFAGVFVQSVTGLDGSTSARQITDLAGMGGVPGQARNGARTMLVTVFLAATSDLSLKYGLAWLDAVLHDDCEGGCAGATMCFLASCPDCGSATADDCWKAQARTLHDVVCVDGPSQASVFDLAGCGPGAVGATVEFTLVAAVPFIYRFPEVVAEALTFTAPPPSDTCSITWHPVGSGRGTCPAPAGCGPQGGCADDPATPAPPAIPAPGPPALCLARPSSAWTAATAPPGLIPRWLDSVAIITVSPGPADLRRLSLRLHANPLLTAITGPDEVDPCTAVAEVNVSYLARDTALVIDGRTQEAYVICPGGGREPADRVLSGPGGAAFEWPQLVCGANVSVLALVDAAFYHPEAAVTVELAARTDVA